MEFGILLGPVFPPRGEMSSQEAFEIEVEHLERAATAGFEAVSLNHHYLVGPEAQGFQPMPMCGYVLARHPELYVATTIFILPYHRPVEMAEQIATLDMMAPGRFLFGIGQGYRDVEARAAGIEHRSRPARIKESIEAMRLLWSVEGPATFHGEHFSFDDVDIGIRPANAHGPPILLAADKPRTVALVPKVGADHWIPSARHSLPFLREVMPAYKASLSEVGRPFAGLPMTRDVCVAADDRVARTIMHESFTRMMHMQSGWGQPGERLAVPFEELERDRILLGSPEQVAEGLIELHREFGAELVILRVYTPGMDPQLGLEMIDRLGEEVLPLVRREAGTGSLLGAARSGVS